MTNRQRAARIVAIGALLLAGALAARLILARRRDAARRHARRPGPVTPSLVSVTAADTPLGEPGRNLEQRLEEALRETFPASDAIATHIE